MGVRSRREEKQTNVVIVVCVVALLIAGTAAVVVGGLDGNKRGPDRRAAAAARTSDASPNTSTSTRCADVTVRVAPALADPLDAALAAVSLDEAPCLRLVRQQDADAPADIWIPETGLQVTADIGTLWDQISDSLAASPVGLVGAEGTERPTSWVAALDSGALRLPDSDGDGTRLATLSALLEGSAEDERDQVRSALTLAALRTGSTSVRKLVGSGEGVDVLVPVSEQAYLATTDSRAAWLPPRGPLPILDFPLLVNADSDADSDGEIARLAGRVVEWLDSTAGRSALSAAGLRAADLSPGSDTTGAVTALALSTVPVRRVTEWADELDRAATPVRLLTLLDASGSMKERIDGERRGALAVAAHQRLLAQLPVEAEVGMWAFSIDQGGAGRDWVELAPIAKLGRSDASDTHAAVLRDRQDTYLSLLRGGTGLYDTVLAGYRAAQQGSIEGAHNLVVLFSDGSNDDPDSIGLEALLAALGQGTSGQHAVRIVAVGIGSDVDMSAMRQIAEATDGIARRIDQADQIPGLFAEALRTG